MATRIPARTQLPQQHNGVWSANRRFRYGWYGSSFEPRFGRGIGFGTCGSPRYLRTLLGVTCSSTAIARADFPSPCSSKDSHVSTSHMLSATSSLSLEAASSWKWLNSKSALMDHF